VESIAQVLEIVAAILLLGAAGEFVFSRTGIPDVLWLVCAGILAGPVFELVSPALLQCRCSVPSRSSSSCPAARPDCGWRTWPWPGPEHSCLA